MRGRITEARVAVEATPCPQAHEDLARTPLEPPLQLHGVVARVEDEQGDGLSCIEPTQQSPDLLRGDLIRFLVWPDALHAYWGGPALAHEVEIGDELVGPPSYDRLAGGVARRMVIVAALGTRLGVAAYPHACVHGKDGCLPFGVGERMADEQVAHDFGVDLSAIQGGV